MLCKNVQNKLSKTVNLNEFSKILSEEQIYHLNHCDVCQEKLNQYFKADDLLKSMQNLTLPKKVTANYLAGIYQKLEPQLKQPAMTLKPEPETQASRSFFQSFASRVVFAGLTVATISFAIWQIGFRNDQPVEILTSDSIEYYMESFNEVSAANPVYVVKEVEYDWAYYESTNSNE